MNDIDLLMSKPALDLTATDIDAIVAYHRKQRAGGKAETAKAARKAQQYEDIDVASIIRLAPATSVQPMKRRGM